MKVCLDVSQKYRGLPATLSLICENRVICTFRSTCRRVSIFVNVCGKFYLKFTPLSGEYYSETRVFDSKSILFEVVRINFTPRKIESEVNERFTLTDAYGMPVKNAVLHFISA